MAKTPEAIAGFQAAAKVSPREPNVHFGLGYLYWKSRRYDEANRNSRPNCLWILTTPRRLTHLGDVEMKKNNSEKALTLLQKSIQLKNDIRIAYVDAGTILARQKRYPEAVTALQKALALDPSEPDAHYQLGHVYQAMGKTSDSQKEFAKVRELHKKSVDEDLAHKMSNSPPALNPVQENPSH